VGTTGVVPTFFSNQQNYKYSEPVLVGWWNRTSNLEWIIKLKNYRAAGDVSRNCYSAPGFPIKGRNAGRIGDQPEPDLMGEYR